MKPTMATLKSFIRKNAGQLFIKHKSSFDGMTDCVEQDHKAAFLPAVAPERSFSNNLGIAGAWIVGQSRDYINEFNAEGFRGFEVYNCCGSFVLAVKSV